MSCVVIVSQDYSPSTDDPSKDANIKGDAHKTLFVGRLSYDTTADTLFREFGRSGAILRLRLVQDRKTGKSRGYAFIEFKHTRDCDHAYKAMHQQVIDGRTILVDIERERVQPGWVPRRLGGGLGGKKESGQLRFGGRECPHRPAQRTARKPYPRTR